MVLNLEKWFYNYKIIPSSKF